MKICEYIDDSETLKFVVSIILINSLVFLSGSESKDLFPQAFMQRALYKEMCFIIFKYFI